MYPHVSNDQLENEHFKNTIITAGKISINLWINLSKNVPKLYSESYKTLITEIKSP